MIKALIVDDEDSSRDYLKILIEKHVPEITSVLQAGDALSAKAFIEQQHPQLIFLDVEMPQYSGFDLLNMMSEKDFDVIFTTAFHQYAIKAIRFSALDYLMKPIDADELRAAMDRYVEMKPAHHQRSQLYNHLLNSIKQPPSNEFKLAIPTAQGVIFFSPADIIRCEAERSYTQFFLQHEKKFIASKPLKEYEELLAENGFMRVHKSHLVNMNCVSRYLPSGFLVMNDDSKVEVARRRKAEVESILRNHN